MDNVEQLNEITKANRIGYNELNLSQRQIGLFNGFMILAMEQTDKQHQKKVDELFERINDLGLTFTKEGDMIEKPIKRKDAIKIMVEIFYKEVKG